MLLLGCEGCTSKNREYQLVFVVAFDSDTTGEVFLAGMVNGTRDKK